MGRTTKKRTKTKRTRNYELLKNELKKRTFEKRTNKKTNKLHHIILFANFSEIQPKPANQMLVNEARQKIARFWTQQSTNAFSWTNIRKNVCDGWPSEARPKFFQF